MRVCSTPLLRKFWYCVAPSADLTDRPLGTRVLDQPVALWRDTDGTARAVIDRCLHRTARLSLGTVHGGNIVCPYHGWTFNGHGQCVKVPQLVEHRPNPFGVEAYHCAERYGYVWVALEEPLFDIPAIAEFGQPGWRQVHEFHEVWNASPQRIIENAFDPAHISFVHKDSFGRDDPSIDPFRIDDTPDGFVFTNVVKVVNAEHMKAALAMNDDETTRDSSNRFHLPFSRVGRIVYPNGLVHILCTFLTPIDDTRTRFTQFVVRNDTEADVPADTVVAFDRQVTREDLGILESTDPDVPLDRSEGTEVHMMSDRPGVAMRRQLRALMQQHTPPESAAAT
ncbi:MAG: aromatic ring-hydroxylating dioxygenase subunit alpha [Burkholderiales bacterium]|jgi:phenylpropionate dioxygenase-like ring-hydroxylating dioxygenase large terminal subunit|nr:aromatic ring-hydroxylating dioxygenase subunit alpha [Burkholderiales bacterium]